MIIRREDLEITPWRNGLGRKAAIASGDGWALSFAWLDADADFSDFIGFDRTQVLLEGAGFVLDFGDEVIRIEHAAEPRAYDGGRPVRARLLDGPCLVLNAVSRRSTHIHDVAVSHEVPTAGFAVVLDGNYDTIQLPDPHLPATTYALVTANFRALA